MMPYGSSWQEELGLLIDSLPPRITLETNSIDPNAKTDHHADFTALPFADAKELVENPEDLVECYRKALACIDRVRARGFALTDALVDYTGGTKPMSAALAMAAARAKIMEAGFIVSALSFLFTCTVSAVRIALTTIV